MTYIDHQKISDLIEAEAKDLGFSLYGFTGIQSPQYFPIFKEWISAGLHGEMSYLSRQDTVNKRLNPQLLFPEAKSILVLAYPYPSGRVLQNKTNLNAHTGRIASYAWQPDYHQWLIHKLNILMENVQAKTKSAIKYKCFTDSAPILERELAMRAGLGWIGRNSCLLSTQHGSFFLLGEIFMDLEVPALDLPSPDYCGTCMRCIEACPTSCILPNRTLDSRKCISYLTIESKQAIPMELRPSMGDWVFGCDICQTVCPWNQRGVKTSGTTGNATDFLTYTNLIDGIQLTEADFAQIFQDSPLLRSKRKGLLRNIAVALGNQPDADLLPLYQKILESESEPIVRQHVAWAVSRVGTDTAIDLLKKEFRLETDPTVQAEYKILLS
jgi:epoxyqueuosine reductase